MEETVYQKQVLKQSISLKVVDNTHVRRQQKSSVVTDYFNMNKFKNCNKTPSLREKASNVGKKDPVLESCVSSGWIMEAREQDTLFVHDELEQCKKEEEHRALQEYLDEKYASNTVWLNEDGQQQQQPQYQYQHQYQQLQQNNNQVNVHDSLKQLHNNNNQQQYQAPKQYQNILPTAKYGQPQNTNKLTEQQLYNQQQYQQQRQQQQIQQMQQQSKLQQRLIQQQQQQQQHPQQHHHPHPNFAMPRTQQQQQQQQQQQHHQQQQLFLQQQQQQPVQPLVQEDYFEDHVDFYGKKLGINMIVNHDKQFVLTGVNPETPGEGINDRTSRSKLRPGDIFTHIGGMSLRCFNGNITHLAKWIQNQPRPVHVTYCRFKDPERAMAAILAFQQMISPPMSVHNSLTNNSNSNSNNSVIVLDGSPLPPKKKKQKVTVDLT